MSLKIQKIDSGFRDMKKLEQLNQEAFPDEERMPVSEMIELAENNKIELTAIYAEEVFVGFYALTFRKNTGYVLFLAVCPELRSCGYGGEALAMMKKQYSGCQIVLDMERIDESADNAEQRKSRKRFYLKNGFYETGYLVEYKGLQMEVLCSGPEFYKEEFQSLLEHLEIRKIPFQMRRSWNCCFS